MLQLLLLLLLSCASAHPAVRVGALPPRHTAAGQAEGAHVSWALVDGAAAAGLRQIAAEVTVTDAATGATLLNVTRDFSGAAAARAGTAVLSPAELARLPASRALSYAVRARLSHGGWTARSAAAPWRVGPGARAAAWPGGARWICSSPAGAADLRSTLLRAEFALPAGGGGVASAALHVAGLGQFRVAVNGVDLLGAEFNAPPQTDWRRKVLYATYDVPAAALVVGGANALAAQIGNGMYNVPAPPARYTKWTGSFGPRMLLAALVVQFADGTNATVATASGAGSPWSATDGGPVSFSHEYAGEDRNASLTLSRAARQRRDCRGGLVSREARGRSLLKITRPRRRRRRRRPPPSPRRRARPRGTCRPPYL